MAGRRGARGRLGIDFLAVRRRGQWDVRALEVNLRKGGTTHPFTALRHLAPGSYDAATGRYDLDDGAARRCYRSSDGLLDPSWTMLAPAQVIDAVAAAGPRVRPRPPERRRPAHAQLPRASTAGSG